MSRTNAVSALLAGALALVSCNSSKFDASKLKPVDTHKVDDLNVVLMSETGELALGTNDFVVQFQDQQGRPVDVGNVQLGSSMTMPGMTPMSGESEITSAGSIGTYRVKSNFHMSGSWHFTLSWNGAHGQGQTAFNSSVR